VEGYSGYESKWLGYLRGRNLEHDPFLRSFAPGAQMVILSRWLQELRVSGIHGQAVAALRYYFVKNGEPIELFNREELSRVREHLRPSDRETHERRKQRAVAALEDLQKQSAAAEAAILKADAAVHTVQKKILTP
jgi:hypothetical protein